MSDGNEKDGQLASMVMDAQLRQQGIGCIQVKDGQVFLFSEYVLEKLLEQSRSHPDKCALVFIKRGPEVAQFFKPE